MKLKINWDAFGIITSIACAIHCAVLPLVLTSLPLFGFNIIENVAFEYFMILLAFAIGGYAFWHGYRHHHHRFLPGGLFAGGIGFLLAKQCWHQYQLWLLPFAVILIVSAHLLNFRLSRVRRLAPGGEGVHKEAGTR